MCYYTVILKVSHRGKVTQSPMRVGPSDLDPTIPLSHFTSVWGLQMRCNVTVRPLRNHLGGQVKGLFAETVPIDIRLGYMEQQSAKEMSLQMAPH